MRLEIKTLQRDLGVTALYVTHDQVEAMTLADRMIVMNAGVADQIGAPLEVYANPQTAFVAGFIGSPPTNFLPANMAAAGAEADRIGIRPEHMQIGPQGRLQATVAYTEALGAETLVHLRLADGSMVTARQDASHPIPHEGDSSFVDWQDRDVMRFGSDGRRL
jgi:sn-glycerol 3-phosphate transport system ATP-binding protein